MSFFFILMVYVILGAAAGFLSGLFGAGGGLVMVPGLVLFFQWQTENAALAAHAMHVAVGTSLAVMMPLSLRSLLSHIKYRIHFFPIFKKMAPGVLVGVIVGATVAHFIYSRQLEIIFGCFVMVMAIRLIQNRHGSGNKKLPGALGLSFAGLWVGMLSGLLGLGGSAFSVPFLTRHGVSIREAVVVSIAIAMIISVVGAITFYVTGLQVVGLPSDSLGYIYVPAWIGLVFGGICVSPIAVRLSHHIAAEKLKVAFALFLFVVAIKMLWS
jgi:uncharacterized membrane protein YfcA